MEQRAETCRTHPSCVEIRCFENGRMIWHSHLPVSAAPRINLDYPDVTERGLGTRWRLPTPEEAVAMAWDDETLRRIAWAGAQRELAPAKQLADAVGVALIDLADEANVKGWQ